MLKIKLHDERLYRIWQAMYARCYYPTHKQYKYYGGKGIKVCDEWHSFVKFVMWAAVNGYSDELSIDRINVNGDYEPNNCRWATAEEQANNKGNTQYKYKDVHVVLDQRKCSWQYRFKLPTVNGKRHYKSKSGFTSKESAFNAAKLEIDSIFYK